MSCLVRVVDGVRSRPASTTSSMLGGGLPPSTEHVIRQVRPSTAEMTCGGCDNDDDDDDDDDDGWWLTDDILSEVKRTVST